MLNFQNIEKLISLHIHFNIEIVPSETILSVKALLLLHLKNNHTACSEIEEFPFWLFNNFGRGQSCLHQFL